MFQSSREHRSGYDSEAENERLARLHAQVHLHTNNLGVITELNDDGSRASVTISQYKMHNNQDIEVQLIDVPVHKICIGNFYIDAKLEVGGECRVHYCERDIRTFLRTGNIQRSSYARIHDLADAYIVPTCMTEAAVSDLDGRVGLIACMSELAEIVRDFAAREAQPQSAADALSLRNKLRELL